VAQEKEVADITTRITERRWLGTSSSVDLEDMESLTANELGERVNSAILAIKRVSRVSKGLKGTFQKALKEAVASIDEAFEVLKSRTSTEETIRLRAENTRLVTEMAELRSEQGKLRADLSQLRQERLRGTDSIESEQFSLLLKEVSNLSARFSRSQRILEIALKSGNLKGEFVRDLKLAAKDLQEITDNLSCRTVEEETRRLHTDNTRMRARITDLERGIMRAVGKMMDAKLAGIEDRLLPPRLSTPRSAAVIITLQEDAVSKGVTYKEALLKAKERIGLDELGICQLKIHQTATGARMIELSGSQNVEKADKLAEKLRGVLAPIARINRPTKRADLRIGGLDDSVSTEEVVWAMALKGGCAPEEIKKS
ncbi:unnamed protein product, partial [Leptidea sinapis]